MTTFKLLQHVLIREEIGTGVINARFIGSNDDYFKFQKLTLKLRPKKGEKFVYLSEKQVKQLIIRL